MNLICNNCVGARLYEVANEQWFSNPFMWHLTVHKYFIELIKNFDSIDLSKAEFELEYFKYKDKRNVLCVIDNKIYTHFTHYIQDDSCEKPTKCGNDIMRNDILDYTKEKYHSRLKRMCGSPLFVYSFNNFNFSDEEYKKRLKETFGITDKPIYIITSKSRKTKDVPPSNIKVIYLDDSDINGTTGSIAKKTYNQILNHYE